MLRRRLGLPTLQLDGLFHAHSGHHQLKLPLQTEIAASEGIDLGLASKMSRLAQLAPDLIEAIALGRLDVSVSQLLRGRLSASWLAQREALVAGWR